MKKMNSMDTPLGTLNKQLKKQETMQTPYIILSGSGRDTGFVFFNKGETSGDINCFKTLSSLTLHFYVKFLVHQRY